MCVCVCVRERVYVDRLYFKLAASHSRGNLNNAEDVRAHIFNVWLCHAFYFIDCYVLTLIICQINALQIIRIVLLEFDYFGSSVR